MTADQLKTLLARRGLSQRELARRMGVHFTTVSRWCLGKTPVDAANALLIRQTVKSPRA